MPEIVKKYRIFIASPSDVADERESINDVIKELNISYGQPNGIVLELLRWETNSAPGIVSNGNVQDIINSDIGDVYDLFIGLLWKKFGTKTLVANSGTEEEFTHAFNRYKSKPESLQILFYFKISAPNSLSEINPEELQMVQNFQRSLGEKGLLYWEFNTINELQSFLRLHIPKRITELEKHNSSSSEHLVVIEDTVEEFEELGTLDLQDSFTEAMDDSNESLGRISEALEWVGVKVTEKAEELSSMQKKKVTLSNNELRTCFQKTARIMNDFADRIEPDTALFIQYFQAAAQSLSELVNYANSEGDKLELETTVITLDNLMNTIDGTIIGMDGFLASVTSLPRVEKELNKARRNVEQKVITLINNIKISYSIAEELKKQVLAKVESL